MTDLTPNDLSHLSDEEFIALCPQGEHAPGPEPLSPAAQAIFFAADGMKPRQYRGRALAAALRALADQVIPRPARFPEGEYKLGIRDAKRDVRLAILAIATELENAQ